MNPKHVFSAQYEAKKAALLAALSAEERAPARRPLHLAIRLLAAAAVLSLLTVSGFAAVHMIDFSWSHEDSNVRVSASLPETTPVSSQDTVKPLRSWRAEGEEISVRLVFAYMPDDLSEHETTPGKWHGSSTTRGISFSGIDLRRSPLENVIPHAVAETQFTAGENQAYLVTSDGVEAYNKTLFVLFEEEEMIVRASIGRDLSEDEVRAIAAGMTLEQTTDVSFALPIANEQTSANDDIPFVVYHNREPIYYRDLLAVGESGVYEDPFGRDVTTVESFEILDNVRSLSPAAMLREDLVGLYSDESGNLIPYPRTEYIPGDENTPSRFGETEMITKRLVCVTLTLERSHDEEHGPYLHTFRLSGMTVDDDGIVHGDVLNATDYVYDSTPATHPVWHDAVYRESLGGGRWRVGYLLDEDEFTDELLFSSDFSDFGGVHFVLK